MTQVVAHGVGSRSDLPMPLFYAFAGAVAALVVSFLALGLLWPDSRFRGGRVVLPLSLHLPGLRVLALAGLLGTVGWLVLGGPENNPGPHLVYVLFWVGLVPLSLAFGPVWRRANPFRLLPDRAGRPLPQRLGYWPAAVALFAFTWTELVAPDPAAPTTLLTFLGAYALAQVLGTVTYGHAWLERGDPFEVFSTLLGHLSPFERGLRSPFDHLDAIEPAPGLVATICVLLGSTGYDGLSAAPSWVAALQSGPLGRVGLGTVGLLTAVLLVAALYSTCLWLAGRISGTRGLSAHFAHSLVPIAAGYLVAHYFSLFLFEGQQAVILALGLSAEVDRSAVSPAAIATVQVLAIVIGHVVGVIAAHDRSVRLLPPERAVAGQIPLFVLMLGYTLGGLTLLFAA